MKQTSKTEGAQLTEYLREKEYNKALERVHKKINKILNDHFATQYST